ncbi:MAG: adenylate/guanylate cyclase domain-containing protein [Rubrivivax sp.]|nr:adenylate/guanylate cyclase domain-containing protein [Rubrivivax sp.]
MDAPTPPPQRRQVSVLFVDIVGSTMLTRTLDPEDVSEVMDGTLALFTAQVQQHGGRVLQYVGDGLLAVFGADSAREDDAGRAVHAGLALLQTAREQGARVQAQHGYAGFDVRVGVHSGDVLLGSGVDAEGAIRGYTVNIAARMEQTAPPGHLRISHDTWRLVRGGFEVQAQPPLLVKGQDEPLLTYLVQRALPRSLRVAARGVEGLHTPLVGRDDALARLLQAFEATAAGGGLQAVTVLADAGLGKSRLLLELQRRLDAHPRSCWLLLGRSQPDSRLQPYGLLREVLAWRLQITDSSTGEAARQQLLDGLRPLLQADAADPTARDADGGVGGGAEGEAALLGQLVGMDFSGHPAVVALQREPRLLRDRAWDVFARWVQGLAASDGSSVVMLLDDLQWADDASLDWLQQLGTRGSLPLTLVLAARPGLLDMRPAWGEGWAGHTLLPLQPLGAGERGALTDALLQRLPEVPQALRAVVEGQAEGNPYYAEELVQMLIDAGVIDTGGPAWVLHADRLHAARIPPTLVGVLQARLDALGAAERHALQQASIVGPVFWDDALSALDPAAPAQLPTLHGKAMVQPRAESTFADTREEGFQHHLLHQVTYDTVLRAERRNGHARAARWLAERVGDREDEYLGITAEHYERAGDHERALDWYERAMNTAAARFANQAALGYAARLLALPNLGDTPRRYRALIQQSAVADLVGDRSLQAQALAARLQLAELLDDDALRAEALVGQALLHDRLGEHDAARTLAERGVALAAKVGAAVPLALGHGELCWLARHRGDLALARHHVEIALVQAALAAQQMRARSDHIYEVSLRLVACSLYGDELDFDRQRQLAEESLALAEARGLVRLQCSAHEVLATHALDLLDNGRAQQHTEAMDALARSAGMASGIACAQSLRARVALQRGDDAAALRHAREGEALYTRIGGVPMTAECQRVQALALLNGAAPARDGGATGEDPGTLARALLSTAAQGFDSAGMVSEALRCRLLLAGAWLQAGRVDTALAAVQAELPALAEAGALDSGGADAWLAACRVLQAAGDPHAAALWSQARASLLAWAAHIRDPVAREHALQGRAECRALLAGPGA